MAQAQEEATKVGNVELPADSTASLTPTNDESVDEANTAGEGRGSGSKKDQSALRPIVQSLKDAARVLPFVPNKFKEYTWEELEEIEHRRREILPRVGEGFWEILSHWDGTCLRFLSTDPLLFMTIILYILVRLFVRLGSVPSFVDNLGNDNVTILGGFLSFFLVLYVNKSHARYFGLYNLSMGCKGRIFDVAAIVTPYLPKPTARRLIRYMNAAHISGYVGLNNTYPAATFFKQMNDDFGLLSKKEMARMNKINLEKGGSANRELIVWSMRVVQQCHAEGMIDNELAHQLRDQLVQLRANIGQLYNAADLPVPFFYVHFISLLTFLYLPLFALTTGFAAGTGEQIFWTADLIGGLVVIFQSAFVIGLRILGQEMNDPYGDDLIDLSVMFYCTFTWRMSNRTLEAAYAEIDPDDELEMTRARNANLGAAWESEAAKSVEA